MTLEDFWKDMENTFKDARNEGKRGGGFERYDWFVERLPLAPANILELGINTGEALWSITELGFETTGADFMEVIKRIQKHPDATYVGINLDGPDGTLVVEDWIGKFDAIIAGEILQHVIFPMNFLYRAWHYLKPDGILLISTRGKDYFVNIKHVHSFTPAHLTQMLIVLGFEVIEMSQEKDEMNLWCYAKKRVVC